MIGTRGEDSILLCAGPPHHLMAQEEAVCSGPEFQCAGAEGASGLLEALRNENKYIKCHTVKKKKKSISVLCSMSSYLFNGVGL